MSTAIWEFNSDIAKVFVAHARQHIPNYDTVIDKCVLLSQDFIDKDGAIIDVGCATGETLRRLKQSGFSNLHGVEASQAMLEHCDPDLAQYYHSDTFPNKKFDAVFCNWTLHFIKDKISYLSAIHSNLDDHGFLVLSDKTSLDPVCIKKYHEWKSSQGVTEKQIQAKEQSVKDVMFINSPKWYLDTLQQVGFGRVEIIDADWCFTTFLCRK
jgi:tRNA (cmo5U34)-methyltransferase